MSHQKVSGNFPTAEPACKVQIEHDIAALLMAWEDACPEARRAFSEAHFALDGWPAAQPVSTDEAMDSARWTTK
jgi:hypothetical protein